MLTIFNRRELLSTFSPETQENVRGALKRGGIAYRLRVRNLTSAVGRSYPGGHRIAPFRQDGNMQYEYIFYVHRDDVAEAAGILAREGIRLH